MTGSASLPATVKLEDLDRASLPVTGKLNDFGWHIHLPSSGMYIFSVGGLRGGSLCRLCVDVDRAMLFLVRSSL